MEMRFSPGGTAALNLPSVIGASAVGVRPSTGSNRIVPDFKGAPSNVTFPETVPRFDFAAQPATTAQQTAKNNDIDSFVHGLTPIRQFPLNSRGRFRCHSSFPKPSMWRWRYRR